MSSAFFIPDLPSMSISAARLRSSSTVQSSYGGELPPRDATSSRLEPAAAFAIRADFSLLLPSSRSRSYSSGSFTLGPGPFFGMYASWSLGSIHDHTDPPGGHRIGYKRGMAEGQTEPPDTPEDGRHESRSQHADRNFEELVQELRVAQTGVQILFGFLLVLAFYDTFPIEDTPHPQVLTGALLSSLAAALCFMAPVMAHRAFFREGVKEGLVWVAHTMLIVGSIFFAVGLDLAIWLVLARLWTDTVATATALVLVPVVAVIWFLLPRHIIRIQDSDRAQDGD